MAMRLLISGSRKNTNTISYFFTRNFPGTFEWELLTFSDAYADLSSRAYYRVLNRFYPSRLVDKADTVFLQQVEEFKPTIILIFKGMEISSRSLKKVKAMGIKLVNYNFDHPFKFFSAGTGNRFVKEAIPWYDLHITYSAAIERELQKEYNVKTALLPFAYSLANGEFEEILKDDRPEINRACFVGNPDHLRVVVIQKLIKEGIPLDVYGFGWEKHFESDESITIYPPKKAYSYWPDQLEFWKVLRQYRVQLNFLRPHNEDSHNLRSFEIPAAGGIMLAPDSTEHRTYFTPDKEIFLFKDFGSCLEKCRMIMNFAPEKVAEIRLAARKRSVESNYSYEHRTRQLLEILKTV
jgi:spore maturation protein CgeB